MEVEITMLTKAAQHLIRTRPLVSIVILITLVATSCFWIPQDEPRLPFIVNKSSTLEISSTSVSPGATVSLTAKLMQQYNIESQTKVHEFVGVCFIVDGVYGGFCDKTETGKVDKSPFTIPLPPCIKLIDASQAVKDLGTFELAPHPDTKEQKLSYELKFTCNQSKNVQLGLTWYVKIKRKNQKEGVIKVTELFDLPLPPVANPIPKEYFVNFE